MGTIRHFRDLTVWQIADEIRKDVYRLTDAFPASERYGMTSQLRRAAFSIAANIAEGFGRFHYQENIQFCRQARGSLEEVCDGLIFANHLELLPANEYQGVNEKIGECRKVLNGYIQSLRNRKSEKARDQTTITSS